MTAWRSHPRLEGRFHPEAPDDVQVLVHDGGPRLTDRRPELVWVRVTGHDGDVFVGKVLNRPQQLTLVEEGSEVYFLASEGGEYPIQVRPKYLAERETWVIHPCKECGLDELFDAPSDLIKKVFPNLQDGDVPMMFTAFCGACGGVQSVELAEKPYEEEDDEALPPATQAPKAVTAKRWWEFWK